MLKFILKLSISLVFVAWLVFETDWNQVFSQLKNISPIYIFIYVLVLIAGMVISSFKWKFLLAHKSISASIWRCFSLYLTGTFINNFMPSTIGGDTYRAYQVGKESGKFKEAAASVVFDRLTGLFSVMILTGVFAIFQWQQISAKPQLKAAIVAVLLVMHAFIFFTILTRLSIWKRISLKLPEKIRLFGTEIVHYREDGAYFKSILFSVLFSFVGVAISNWVFFLAADISISFLNYLSVIFTISIITSLPISINNIGVKEWAYVTFFGYFGVPASAVVAVALLSRIVQMLVSFSALPLYLRERK